MAQVDSAEQLRSLHIDRGHRKKRRRGWRWVAAAAALLIVVEAAWALSRPAVVRVGQVRQSQIGEAQTELSSSGFVVSRRRSILAPKIPGRLTELAVSEGESVKEGQVVARLDPLDQEVALREAQAEIRTAESLLAQARTEQEQARLELRRAQILVSSGAATKQEHELAETRAHGADAQVRAANSRLQAARQGAQAAEIHVEDTVVRAPFAGTVVHKLADEGAVLAPATIGDVDVGGIVEIVDLSALEVEAEVSEDELRRVKLGQPTLIFLDAFPNKVWRGRAESIRPSVDRAKATVVVKVRFEDDSRGVLPGMGSRVAFLTQPLPPSALTHGQLRAPASAVVERGGKPVLFAVKDGRARMLPVQTAERVGKEVVLREGPASGTTVVTSPRGRLRDGARVRVSQEKR